MLKLLKRKQKQGGFTLLELLMVVIIIAILASIALPQYFKAAERSRASEAVQILATIRGSEGRYKAMSLTKVYTSALDDLDVGVPGSTGVPLSTMWTYSLAPPLAVATRAGSGATVSIDLETGATCTDDNPTYGLGTTC
ncbi:MAG: hypothetical protein A3C53_02665 [Omnitrophica WOR_2 bacterium RIFCSPHIGHO2_02_FULL_68_15]|nr:MAG: hypothetical protein A3C53_02665 [Omnitrophica WOR_2 bacterium RIFCSPHIGHO2_02_FULL_68_15]